MNYIHEVVVKHDFVTGKFRLPAGLKVKVPHDLVTSPLYSLEGKKRIAEALMTQCGIDMRQALHYINTAFMDSHRL